MKNEHGSGLVKNSMFLLFNSVFMMLSSWVISILVARWLGPEDYGIFNLTLWLTGTITWAAGMGFVHAITKFTAELNEQQQLSQIKSMVLYIFKIEFGISALITVLVVIFRVPLADFFFSPSESYYFLLAAIGILPGIATALISGIIEGLQKFKYFTYANLIITPLSFVSKIIVLNAGYGLTGLLMVMLVFSFVNTIFYGIVLHYEGLFKVDSTPLKPDLKKRILDYNKSVIAILFCDKIVWDKSENFFLGRFCSAGQIAFYNLGFNIVQRFTSILPSTFWKVLFPAMASMHGTGDIDKMKRLFYLSTRYVAFTSFPVGVAGIVLAYQLIHYLYGHEFIGAQRVLQIIFAASIFSNLSNPASAVLYGFEKQAFIYRYGLVLAAVNIIIDIILIKPYGASGAAICYGITTILGSVGGLIYTCRTMGLRYPFFSVFKILVSSLIMGAAMEAVVQINHEIPGFIISIFTGIFVFIVSTFFLGSFENEDYTLMEHFQDMFPPKVKPIIKVLLKLSDFKKKLSIKTVG